MDVPRDVRRELSLTDELAGLETLLDNCVIVL